MAKRSVTLADVAQASGVSKATASLVMRDSELITEATRDRVLQAAADLGYVRNRAAAALRAKRTGTVGLIVTRVANPFFAEVIEGMESRFREGGRNLILTQHSDSISGQRRMIEVMLENQADGVVIVPAYNTPPADMVRLTDAGIAVLFLTRRIPGLGGSYIGADNVTGARMATEHLISHGCTSLALIGGAPGTSSQREREDGVVTAVSRLAGSVGVTSHPGATTMETGYAVALDLLSAPHPPDGIVAYNDIVALGIQAAVSDTGRVLGADVRLIGFDDVAVSSYLRPALSSINSRPGLMGAIAADTLGSLITEPGEERTVLLPTTLSARASCGCN